MSRILLFFAIGLIATTCFASVTNAEKDSECATTFTPTLIFKTKEELAQALENDPEIQSFFECYRKSYQDQSHTISTEIAINEPTEPETTSSTSSTVSFPDATESSEILCTVSVKDVRFSIYNSVSNTSQAIFSSSTKALSTSATDDSRTFSHSANAAASTHSTTSKDTLFSYINSSNIEQITGQANYTCGEKNYSYAIVAKKQNYQSANYSCHGRRGTLAAKGMRNTNIRSVVIQDLVEPLQKRQNKQNIWIGLDVLKDDQWLWADGDQLNKNNTNWAEGEPNDRDKAEECAHLVENKDNDVNDIKCDKEFYYLCEKVMSATSTE